VIAQGKTRVAHNKGELLPPGCVIDDQGRPTQDPRYAVVPPFGALLTFGGHKGYGLALMCELLGGSLTGMKATGSEEGTGADRFRGNGMLSFYIDPKVVDPEQIFPQDVARYVAYFKSAKPASAGGEVLIPGEPEERTRQQRLREGVPLPDDTWASIIAAARAVGVDELKIQQLGAA